MESTLTDSFDAYFDDLMVFSRMMSDKYLEDVLQLIITVACNVAETKGCAIWLADSGGGPGSFSLRASHTTVAPPTAQLVANLDEQIVRHIARRQKNDWIRCPSPAGRSAVAPPGVYMLGMPLKDPAGGAVGVMGCFTTAPGVFGEKDIRSLAAVAEYATTAIMDTETFVKTRVAQEELATRALISSATNALMQQYQLGEESARCWFKKMCFESLKSARGVAEDILLSSVSEAPLGE